MTVRKSIDDLGGRKFTIAAGIEIVASVALFMRVIDQTTWLHVSGLVLALYGAANVSQKVGTARATAARFEEGA